LSVNFSRLQLPIQADGHRLNHIHKNSPGVLARINKILADSQANISGQYLATNKE
jgi:D-3-phosphoglycerate dehydrogenase